MSEPKDEDSGRGGRESQPGAGAESARGQPEGSAPDQTAGSDKRSGRVGYDERGNSVWEWQLETGVYSRDVSTQKLKKLELGDLSIAETAIHKRPEGLGGDVKSRTPGGGFNPYDNSSSTSGGFNPYDSARSTSKKLQPSSAKPVEPPPRKPADMQKLDEWMKMKKRLEEQKGQDEEE